MKFAFSCMSASLVVIAYIHVIALCVGGLYSFSPVAGSLGNTDTWIGSAWISIILDNETQAVFMSLK